MDLADMRDLVEIDLHDETNEVWSTAEIDRAIQRAIEEFSYAIPVEDSYDKATLASREIDISSLTDRVIIEAVEYPTDNYPKTYVRFSVWADTLTLQVDAEPDGTYDAKVYYGKIHSLVTADAWEADTVYAEGDCVLPTTKNGYRYICTTAGTSDAGEPTWPTTIGITVNDNTAVWTCEAITSSIPTVHERLIAQGGAGFALTQWAAESINKVNVGEVAALRYQKLGSHMLDSFRWHLKRLGRQNRVRVRQSYTPYYPIVSKNTVVGP
jgi:hypothetical protein